MVSSFKKDSAERNVCARKPAARSNRAIASHTVESFSTTATISFSLGIPDFRVPRREFSPTRFREPIASLEKAGGQRYYTLVNYTLVKYHTSLLSLCSYLLPIKTTVAADV